MYTYDPTPAFRDAAGELCVKDAELTPVEGREHVKILRDLPPQWANLMLLYNKTEFYRIAQQASEDGIALVYQSGPDACWHDDADDIPDDDDLPLYVPDTNHFLVTIVLRRPLSAQQPLEVEHEAPGMSISSWMAYYIPSNNNTNRSQIRDNTSPELFTMSVELQKAEKEQIKEPAVLRIEAGDAGEAVSEVGAVPTKQWQQAHVGKDLGEQTDTQVSVSRVYSHRRGIKTSFRVGDIMGFNDEMGFRARGLMMIMIRYHAVKLIQKPGGGEGGSSMVVGQSL